MAVAGNRRNAGVTLLLSLAVIGCAGRPEPKPTDVSTSTAEAAPPPAAQEADITHPVSYHTAEPAAGAQKPASVASACPFAEAIVPTIPDGVQVPPPDRIQTGKSTGVVYREVRETWDQVVVQGRPRVKVSTEHGDFHITLDPTIAPNHVRNLLTLCQVGYYDGLQVDRIVHQESQDAQGGVRRLDLIQLGCPQGSGDPAVGHLGYWLKPELHDSVRHGEGTVGFWHGIDPESAGVVLYITLGPAPLLDGRFTVIGQVSDGQDVVRRIANQPTQDTTVYPDYERPRRRIGIRLQHEQ